MSVLERVAVVLYEPQNDLNIGAVVRAAKNFGISDVRLVRPADGRPEMIRVMAPNAHDLVSQLSYFDTLDEALEGFHHVVGATARGRKSAHVVAEPRGLASSVGQWCGDGERVALMFGREDHGLPNEALDRCNAMVTIPTSPDYASLNLAQAVLLILWEVFRVAEGTEVVDAGTSRIETEHDLAPNDQVERMLGQAEESLVRIGFFKYGDGEHVMRSLRAVFGRARLDTRELSIWFGIFKEIVAYLDRHGVESE